jgi:hypothetical protein
MLQRLDLALGHQRVQLQRQAGRAHHVVDAGGDGQRQAHAAMRGIGRDRDPAALGDLGIGLGEARGGAHDAVFQHRRLQITGALQGGKRGFAQLAGLCQDRLDGVAGGLGEAVGRGDAAEARDMVEDEAVFAVRGAIGH